MRKEIFALVTVIIYFTFGLMFCLQQGIYIFELFDHYAVGLPLLFLQFVNVIVIGWKFDLAKLDKLVNENTGEQFPKLLYFLVRYILMILISVVLVIGFMNELSNPLNLPWWALVIGWWMMLYPILIAIGGLFIDKKWFLCCLSKFS